MSYNPDLTTGVDESGGLYAPANFLDATESTPTGVLFDIGGNGLSTPYTTAVSSILYKQMEEIKGKTTAALNISSTWKRRLRDFMTKKNNDLLDFLKVTVPHHPVLGPGETLLRRFGNPQVSSTHPSVRDMIIDVSGEDVLAEINESLRILSGDGPLKDYAAHTGAIYEMYKEAGDAVLQSQHALRGKLEKLDRVQGKLAALFDIEQNEKYEPLMKANEEYLEAIYKENQIEDDYKKVIEAYRRFVALRDVVMTSRGIVAQESEPLCSICLDEPVAFTLTPCGHTFCQTCIRRQNGSCFICRAPIRDKVKLYFG